MTPPREYVPQRNVSRHRQGGSGSAQGPPVPPVPKLRDDKGKVPPDLFDRDAQVWAKSLTKASNPSSLSTSQLRNLFHAIKETHAAVEATNDFAGYLPSIKMFKSRVAYSVGRRQAPELLKALVEGTVDQVQSKEDFAALCRFFEAVVGFFTYINKGR